MERTVTRVRAARSATILASALFLIFCGIPGPQLLAAEDESSPDRRIVQGLLASVQPAPQAPTIGVRLVPDDKGVPNRLPAFSLSAPVYVLTLRIGKSGVCAFSPAQDSKTPDKPLEEGVEHHMPTCRDIPEEHAAEFAPPSLTVVLTASKPWELPAMAQQARQGCVFVAPSDKKTLADLKRVIEARSRDEAFGYAVVEAPKPDRPGKIRTMEGATFKGAPARPGKTSSRPEEVTGVQGLRPQDVPK
jgi:hypothetical protein